MLLDSLHDSLVARVDAEIIPQGIKDMGAQLLAVVCVAVLVVFERNVGEGAEESVVLDDTHIVDAVEMFLLEVFLEAAGGGAGLGSHLGVEEVESALERALHEGTGVVADTAGEIVGRDVRRHAARRSQTDGEAAGQIEKDFRHEVAGVADGVFALVLCLLYQIVIGFLKQILKEDEMLEIFHR